MCKKKEEARSRAIPVTAWRANRKTRPTDRQNATAADVGKQWNEMKKTLNSLGLAAVFPTWRTDDWNQPNHDARSRWSFSRRAHRTVKRTW